MPADLNPTGAAIDEKLIGLKSFGVQPICPNHAAMGSPPHSAPFSKPNYDQAGRLIRFTTEPLQ